MDSISSSRPEITLMDPLLHFWQMKTGCVIVHWLLQASHRPITGTSSMTSFAPAREVLLAAASKQNSKLYGTKADNLPILRKIRSTCPSFNLDATDDSAMSMISRAMPISCIFISEPLV